MDKGHNQANWNFMPTSSHLQRMLCSMDAGEMVVKAASKSFVLVFSQSWNVLNKTKEFLS